METEGAHRLPQRSEAIVGDRGVGPRAEGRIDHVEVGQEFGGVVVGHRGGRRGPLRRIQNVLAERLERTRQHSGTHRSDRRPEGLVVGTAGLRVGHVAGSQRCQRLRDRAQQSSRQTQFLMERRQLIEVMPHHRPGSTGRRLRHDLGRHERVAVAIAADPGAHADHRHAIEVGIRIRGGQGGTDIVVQRGDHLEERGTVVPQSGDDLVGDGEPTEPDQRRLPQQQDLPADVGGQCGLLARRELGPRPDTHEFGDTVLRVEDAAPTGLGGMRGDHRDHFRLAESGRDVRVLQASGGQLLEGPRQR